MAASHSFAGKHVEDGGDEEADADHDHSDIEHSGLAPFQTIDAPDSPETESTQPGLIRDTASVKIRDASVLREIKTA